MADNEDVSSYDFSHEYRGNAIIIVNANFYDENKKPIPKMNRGGSSKDLKNMKAMFKALDFRVKAYKDLTARAMKDKLIKASQYEEFNKKSDCFALVISSHGNEIEEKKIPNMDKNASVWRHSVLSSDCHDVYIDDVVSWFQDDKAKGLTDKPKLFFIQACRSRHGNQEKRFDYGKYVKVAVKKQFNMQPSDARNQADNAMLDSLDGSDIEDIYKNLTEDDDIDEWNEDDDISDDDIIEDSDEDISDAKGAPDSGYMPRSPSPLLQQQQHIQQPTEDQQLEVTILAPNLPKRDDKSVSQNIAVANNESQGEEPCNHGNQGNGDQADAGGSADSGQIPLSPYDIVPINCPQDCLIVYPTVSGAIAFRRKDLGSRLLNCMNKEQSLQKLMKGCDLLQYLTDISGDMARVDIKFNPWEAGYKGKYAEELKKNMPFKITTMILHRLKKAVIFQEKTKKTVMAHLKMKFKNMFI